MSMWWDDDARKYRSTLVYKVFYVWGWPAIRFVLHNCMKPEQAHRLALHFGIRFVGRIDKLWCWGIVFPAALIAFAILRILLFIPGFHCTPPEADMITREGGRE